MANGVALHRIVALPSGFIALGMAGFMLLCAIVGALMAALASGQDPAVADALWRAGTNDNSVLEMLLCAGITAVVGGALVSWGRPASGVPMRRTEATITTAVIWALTSVLGALPYLIDSHMPIPDAVFEAASGFTTTGATVVADIEDRLSQPVLLWRSLTQWLGGMGIVVLFIAVFPNLGISGKHMFRTEVPGHSADGLKPKITETSWVLWKLYSAFTLVQIGVLMAQFTWWVDRTEQRHWAINLFDAVCHSLTTLSTGGFSTHTDSIGWFQSPLVDVTVSGFMLLAGVNFGLFYGALVYRSRRDLRRGRIRRFLWLVSDFLTVFRRSVEFRVYGGLVVLAVALLGIAVVPNMGGSWPDAFRYALFMVATTITSTGFGSAHFPADVDLPFPSNGLGIVLLLMFIGGMSGSTAGGIKVSRVILLAESTRAQLQKSIRPAVVQITRLGREIISDDTLHAVSTFFFVYMASMAMGTLLVTYTDGVSIENAFGAMLTTLSNMGPNPFYVGDADNFAMYTPTAKLVFAFVMILGRLEFFTVLVLLLPDVWRH
jgi:trk system potassium uptake protein TrkH